MSMKFNEGGFVVDANNSTIGVQFNDKHWSRAAVLEAKKKKTFSQLGDRLTQPKHYGDKIVKYHEIPILDVRNINDQGIDANGVTLISDTWYAYDADGAMVTTGADAGDGIGFANPDGYAKALAAISVWIGYDGTAVSFDNTGAGYATEALAVTAATTGANGAPYTAESTTTGTVKSGDGNLFGGSKDISVQNGSFPALTEEGGMVNRVGMKRLNIEAQVTEFGFYMTFTKKSLDMDTEVGLLARYSRNVGEAQGDVREAQIRNSLLGKSEENRVFAGDATRIGQLGAGDTFEFADLSLMDQSLKLARCPKSTKLIDGSTKVGTTTIGKARYAYVGEDALPTLEDMTHTVNTVVKNVWVPVEDYAAAGTVAMDEIGKIGGFRFIEVEEMPNYTGQGAAIGDSIDDTDYATIHNDGTRYDVFPILFVGSGSFATVGFEGDVARVVTVMPKADAHNDVYGKKGAVSISWYYGIMFLKPEWIRQIACTLKIV